MQDHAKENAINEQDPNKDREKERNKENLLDNEKDSVDSREKQTAASDSEFKNASTIRADEPAECPFVHNNVADENMALRSRSVRRTDYVQQPSKANVTVMTAALVELVKCGRVAGAGRLWDSITRN